MILGGVKRDGGIFISNMPGLDKVESDKVLVDIRMVQGHAKRKPEEFDNELYEFVRNNRFLKNVYNVTSGISGEDRDQEIKESYFMERTKSEGLI